MTRWQDTQHEAGQYNGSNGTNAAGSMVAGFFVGSIVGLAAGVLLAPDRGEVTRTRIRQKAKESMDKKRQRAEQSNDEAEEAIDQAQDAVRTVTKSTESANEDMESHGRSIP